MRDYDLYLKSNHWQGLKEEILYKRGTNCYVCHKTSTLLLHHINYDHLYREKLWKDVIILCYNCHKAVHYWFFGAYRLPRKPSWTLFSIRIRKVIFYTQNHRFGLASIWFLVVVLVFLYNLFFWGVKQSVFFVYVCTVSLFKALRKI